MTTTQEPLQACTVCRAATTHASGMCRRCRDAREPVPSVDFAQFADASSAAPRSEPEIDFRALLEEPEWRPCIDCGSDCNGEPLPPAKDAPEEIRVRCVQCVRKHEAEHDSRIVRALGSSEALATIPERFRWAMLGHAQLARRVKVDDPDREIVRMLNAEQPVVTLASVTAGVGKTSLAAAAMRHAHSLGRSVLWVDAYDLGETKYGEMGTLARRAIEVDYLVIDEWRDVLTPSRKAVDTTVLLKRAERTTRRTTITTGMTAAQIGAVYGAGVKRRISAPDCAYVVALNRCGTCKHERHEGACSGKIHDVPCHCPVRQVAAS